MAIHIIRQQLERVGAPRHKGFHALLAFERFDLMFTALITFALIADELRIV